MGGKVLVSKFGGTQFPDYEGFVEAGVYIVDRRNQGYSMVPVLSAPYGVSDMLIDAEKSRTATSASKLIGDLVCRYGEILSKVNDRKIRQEADTALTRRLDNLKMLLLHGNNKDRILSDGEVHSGLLLSPFIAERGHIPVFKDGYEAGVTVNGHGTVIMDKTLENLGAYIGPNISAGKVTMVGGYVGKDAETGQYKLMGRNTTDGTGVLVALAARDVLSMDVIYEIIKNVPGVYAAGVKGKKWGIIPRMSYDEAAEIVWRPGVKVVHSMAVEYAKNGNVPIHVKMIGDERYTEISEQSMTTEEKPVISIYPHVIAGISVEDDIMASDEGRGYLEYVSSFMRKNGVNIIDVTTSSKVITMTLSNGSSPIDKAFGEKLCSYLKSEYRFDPSVYVSERGVISITGEGTKEQLGMLARITRTLADSGVNIESASLSDERAEASPNMVFFVDEAQLERGAEALCQELFKEPFS